MEYIIEKRKRRSILIKVTKQGVKILAPWFCTKKHIMSVINEKKDWINKHVSELKEKEQEYSGYGKNYIYILGEKYSITESNEYKLDKITKTFYKQKDTSKSDKIYLKSLAYDYLNSKIASISNKTNIDYFSFKLSSARTKWGSCDKKKNILLNYRLLFIPEYICDYVVIHELCHTQQFNHSKDFWGKVSEFCFNYKIIKKNLHEYDFLLTENF